MDPGLALGPRPNPARGPGPVVDIIFGFGPGSNDSNQSYIKHFGLSRVIHSLFAQKKLFSLALALCS
jgi:hypothetical protein